MAHLASGRHGSGQRSQRFSPTQPSHRSHDSDRRRLRSVRIAFLSAGAWCVFAKWLPGQLAWMHSSAAAAEQENTAQPQNRRSVVQLSSVAAAGASWSLMPDEADAFREDRILNAKDRYSPKMRAFYQKLEGLRDDLILTVEKDNGQREEFVARPADWFDGVDRKLIGPIVLPPSQEQCCGAASGSYAADGILLVPRGQCSFSKKLSYTQGAGAKSMLVYDQRVTKQPEETQGITGAVNDRGMATRSAGDALTGGASLQPVEKGITTMAQDPNAPGPNLGAAMMNLKNGTDLVSYIKDGGKAKVVRVVRQEFYEGIDGFIKKDLKKMLTEMNVFGLSMRASKDDLKDPIVKVLEKDQKEFKAAVESKDYAAIRRAWAVWQGHLDPIGRFELTETI